MLVGVLQAASAAFTPTFQAVIPDIVTEETQYTRALSASQVASTMESLLSPVLAALALAFMTFNWLFVGTSIGFVISAVLVLSTRIPNATASGQTRVWDRISSGIRTFGATSRLRGVLALNLVVASAGSIVVVNTVNYVRDTLGGTESDVAWMLAASGGGTLLAALILPKVLDRVADRPVMLTGATVLVIGVLAAITMILLGIVSWAVTAPIWVLIGAGMALIITPTGRVIRSSVDTPALPAAFAAQFSLSHLAWLITYPIAGWVGATAGLGPAWITLGALALFGAIAAPLLWRREPTPAADATAPAEQHVDADTDHTGVLQPVGAPSPGASDAAAEGTLIAGQCSCVRPV